MARPTKEDLKWAEEYRKTSGKYDRPSVTADIVALRPAYDEDINWRENPVFALEMLFIKRSGRPFKGCWALPGGFIYKGESIEEGARRELFEETALKATHLIPTGVFSQPDRDIRGWVISNAFVSIHRRTGEERVEGGSDAADARWLRLKAPTINGGHFNLPFYDGNENVFTISGTYQMEDLGGGTVDTIKDNPLAFDHGKIIIQSLLRMLVFDPKKLVLFLLPEKFTLARYIDIYTYLTWDPDSKKEVNIPNLRRQLTAVQNPLLVPCDAKEPSGRGHAQARLFRKRA